VRAIGWLLVSLALLGAATALAADAAAGVDSARAGGDPICELLDRVLPLECQPQSSADRTAPAGASEASSPPEPASTASQVRAGELVRRSSGLPRYDPGRLAFTARAGVSRQRIEALLRRAGVRLEQVVPAIRAYMVAVDPGRRAAALALLRGSPAVATAGREVLVEALGVEPNDADWPDQWGLRLAGFPEAWNRSGGSRPITVAVVDTGVDPAQPDLRGVVLPGHDFVNDAGNALDDEGHGTAVAGIIAARTGNREGIAGICASCSILPVKVLDRTGAGDDTVVAAGIVWAADHGAQVINLSLGGPGSTPVLAAALAYASGKGAIVVAAAGNDGASVPFYPAADPNALGVAASDSRDRPYAWSNRGEWVSLAAPGCNPAPGLDGGYVDFCGTSSAAPVVAGLVALAFAANQTATRDQIEAALEQTAVPIGGFARYGRINAPGALSFLTPPAATTPIVPAPSVFHGDLRGRSSVRTYRLTATDGQLTAVLTFAGGRVLSLTLTPEATPLRSASVSGPSPLKLSVPVTAGPIRLSVRGRGVRVKFVLTSSIRAQA